jgi:hypothetical protein
MANTHTRNGAVGDSTKAKRAPASFGASTKGAAHDGAARVQLVLDRFARALTAGDGKGAAAVWETPAFVMGAGMARAVSTDDEVVAFFSGAKEQYTSRGITDTRAEIERLDWVTEDLVVVDVRWPYLNAKGEEMGEERSTYTLMKGSGGELRIRSILMRGAAE